MSKYYNSKTFLWFIIIPLFFPYSFQYIPQTVTLYDAMQVWKLIVLLIIIFSYLLKMKFSRYVFFVIGYSAITFLASYQNNGLQTKVYTNILLAIGLTMLAELVKEEEKFRKFTNIAISYNYVLVLLNLIFLIAYPNGLPFATLYASNEANPMNFLGIDNGIWKSLLPLLFFIFYKKYGDDKVSNTRKDNFIFYSTNVYAFIIIFLTESAAGIVSYLFFIGMMVYFTMFRKKKIPLLTCAIVYLAFLILVVVAGKSGDLIEFFTSLLGKRVSFSGRTTLWALALRMIMAKPLLGYGYTSGNIVVWGGEYSSHNMILEILIQGGALLLVLFVIMVLYSIASTIKLEYAKFNVYNISIISLMLDGLVETGISPILFIVLAIAASAKPEIHKKKRFKITFGG